MLTMLTTADAWITRERVRNYSLMLAAAYLLAMAAIVLSLRHGLDPFGKPLGADFIIFYSASSLALKGHATQAYAAPALLAVQRTLAGPIDGLFLWCYPPTFQLPILPLALAPYRLAFAIWMAATGGLYLAMTRLIARDRLALVLALGFTGVFMNLAQGQNGFLTTALLGGGLLLLDRRPWLAGALLGLLAIKPHFGLLLPLLLAAGGRWRSFAGAAVSAVLLCLLATAMFGPDAWRAFFAALPSVSKSFAAGRVPLAKAPTLFATVRLLGGPAPVALAADLLFAAPFVVATLIAWRRPGPLKLKAGLAVLATLLTSPYLFDYDLMLLAIPLGALLSQPRPWRWPAGGRSVAALLFLTPILVEPIAQATHLQFAPFAVALGFLVTWRVLKDAAAMASQEISPHFT
jgi:hypothetical protein